MTRITVLLVLSILPLTAVAELQAKTSGAIGDWSANIFDGETLIFTGGDATDIIEWHKAEIVLDKITKIITESKHGFESPVANVNIIEALLEYKKD